METPAPYNRCAMPLDDAALADAIRRQEERLNRDPGSLAFAQLADLYLKAGRTRTAGEDASGLGRVLADDTFATVAFGTLCLEQGMVEEAAQTFTRILRKDPDHREARERLETTLRARQRRKG